MISSIIIMYKHMSVAILKRMFSDLHEVEASEDAVITIEMELNTKTAFINTNMRAPLK